MESEVNPLWLIAPLVGQVMDCITTLFAIHWHGATEGNPLFADLIMDKPLLVVGIKVAFGVAAIFLLRWVERREGVKSATTVAVVASTVSWLPVAWNVGGMILVSL